MTAGWAECGKSPGGEGKMGTKSLSAHSDETVHAKGEREAGSVAGICSSGKWCWDLNKEMQSRWRVEQLLLCLGGLQALLVTGADGKRGILLTLQRF